MRMVCVTVYIELMQACCDNINHMTLLQWLYSDTMYTYIATILCMISHTTWYSYIIVQVTVQPIYVQNIV